MGTSKNRASLFYWVVISVRLVETVGIGKELNGGGVIYWLRFEFEISRSDFGVWYLWCTVKVLSGGGAGSGPGGPFHKGQNSDLEKQGIEVFDGPICLMGNTMVMVRVIGSGDCGRRSKK